MATEPACGSHGRHRGCAPHVHALSLAGVSTSVPRRAPRRSTAPPSVSASA